MIFTQKKLSVTKSKISQVGMPNTKLLYETKEPKWLPIWQSLSTYWGCGALA